MLVLRVEAEYLYLLLFFFNVGKTCLVIVLEAAEVEGEVRDVAGLPCEADSPLKHVEIGAALAHRNGVFVPHFHEGFFHDTGGDVIVVNGLGKDVLGGVCHARDVESEGSVELGRRL